MANLPDASSALLSYIDALLVDEETLVQPVREPEIKPSPTPKPALETETKPVSEAEAESAEEIKEATVPEAEVVSEAISEIVTKPQAETEAKPAAEIKPQMVPEVAAVSDPNAIRLLVFKVAGVPLAIEADDIAAVIEANEAMMHRDDDGGDSVIGVFSHDGRDIHAIDTRAVILPQSHPARLDAPALDRGSILLLAGYDLALFCEETGEIISLARQDVEWRAQRQTRPWLAGMVKERHYALLDIEGLVQVCGLNAFSTH